MKITAPAITSKPTMIPSTIATMTGVDVCGDFGDLVAVALVLPVLEGVIVESKVRATTTV